MKGKVWEGEGGRKGDDDGTGRTGVTALGREEAELPGPKSRKAKQWSKESQISKYVGQNFEKKQAKVFIFGLEKRKAQLASLWSGRGEAKETSPFQLISAHSLALSKRI